MKQLIITDAELLEQLRANAPVNVVDGDCKVIGRVLFLPMTYPELGLTDEELRRRETDPNATWHSTDEVIQRLLGHRRKAS